MILKIIVLFVNCRIAVYDLGGGTFDISILEIQKGVFEVMITMSCLDNIPTCTVTLQKYSFFNMMWLMPEFWQVYCSKLPDTSFYSSHILMI